ncbi:MAG: hypothetical protein U1A78_41535 [Polyangia bacterium]
MADLTNWEQAASYWQRVAEADQLKATQEDHEATLHLRLSAESAAACTPAELRVYQLRRQLGQALQQLGAERMSIASERLRRAALMRAQRTVTPKED